MKQQQQQQQQLHELTSSALSSASHLTRPELLRRRLENLRLLSKCYRDLYWALMDRLKAQFREYLWHYGLAPFKQHAFLEGSGENNNLFAANCGEIRTDAAPDAVVNSSSSSQQEQRCAFVGCKLKPMPLTSFCHLHILSDSRQKLYKPCSYVIKSAQAGPITCGKPILRSTAPSLCIPHLQKAQKHLARTFKRTGLNGASTHQLAPKFHVIVMEYVHHIQVKRRTELRGNKSKIVVQKGNDI